jgi:hypothetical protein
MKYKEISSKYNYYLGVTVAVLVVAFFIIFFQMISFENENSGALLLIFFLTSPYSFYLAYVNVSKNIYGRIDLTKNTFVYGNLLFDQRVDVNSVKIGRRRFLKRNSYVVAIGKNRFFINTSGLDKTVLKNMTIFKIE